MTSPPTTTCRSQPDASVPFPGRTIPDYRNTTPPLPLPDCGDPGQETAFQGADLINSSEDCMRVNICHRTSSVSNPYNTITVDRSSADLNGHADHEGDVFPATDYVPDPDGSGYVFVDENCNVVDYCQAVTFPISPP
ncbi:hypothetical protein ACA910_018883 [Epithemia clementina (nom. ined.)]